MSPFPKQTITASTLTTGRIRRDYQRGAGSFLVAAVSIVVIVVAAALIVGLNYLNCLKQTHSVADLVAISAAQAYDRADQACTRAEQIAQENSHQLQQCQIVSAYGDFIVDVDISRKADIAGLGNIVTIEAHSRAGVINDEEKS